MEFFTDTNEYKFCNGTEWVVQGGGSGDAAPNCEDDDTATCTLDETRSSSDPDFIAENIAYGVSILGITGTHITSTEPDAFSFTDQTGVATGSTVTSDAVTLSGFNIILTATCGTGCTAIARNGVWGGTTVTGFMSGDTIAIRQVASGSPSTVTTATVVVGTYTSDTWSVTTPCSSGSQTFNYTGNQQPFTLPTGCTTATFTAWGAGGGIYSSSAAAGPGGHATGTHTASGGTQYVVVVGGKGQNRQGTAIQGGGGGGYSGVFLSSVSQANALLVAGGGGGAGAGGGCSSGQAGAGGGNAGQAGTGTYAGNYPGGGGTQSSGGAGGTGGDGANGGAGTALQGGGGGGGGSGSFSAGGYGGGGAAGRVVGAGGGGGGYYGGGGGGAYASYAHSNCGGGGGSGYCKSGSMTGCSLTTGAGNAAQTNGKVTVTFSD